MPIFEIKYRRVEEGTFRTEAPSLDKASRLLDIELACGTANLTHSENVIVEYTQIEED